MSEVDVLIIGAGPAGLAAANSCLSLGIDYYVVEKGEPLEHRLEDFPKHVAEGVGGAGLYSDGKISLYPSATAIWNLPSYPIVKTGYGWMRSLISDFFPKMGHFPDLTHVHESFEAKQTADHYIKNYNSFVLSEKQRKELLRRLVAPVAHRIWTCRTVVSIKRIDGAFQCTIRETKTDKEFVVLSKQILFCSGRLAPLSMFEMCPFLGSDFKRFEYGIRIQQSSDEFFLKNFAENDPKLIFTDEQDQVEWRTFCCCKKGGLIQCNGDSGILFSGTTSEKSDLSNVGFNCRIKTDSLLRQYQDEITSFLTGKVPPFSIQLQEFIANDTQTLYGPKLDSLLRKGIIKLVAKYDLKDAVLYGPTLEGAGYYPQLTPNLEAVPNDSKLGNASGFYVAGDSTGLFRGLLAALISGYYIAHMAKRQKEMFSEEMTSKAKINYSSVAPLPTVFTAQSKKFFYCRDVVCQFVLNRGCLPINPFRVFDYFLSDRVDRNLIRQGNNHLIRLCDELWVFGPIADGVFFELVHAAHLQKRVRFFTIGTSEKDIQLISDIDKIVFEPEVHSSRQTRESLLNEIRPLMDIRPLSAEKQKQFNLFKSQ